MKLLLKFWLLGLILTVVMNVEGTTILTDAFVGQSVDSTLWTTSGTATVSSGYLTVNNGGYVQSINSASVSNGDLDVTFTNVGTSNGTSFNMQLGLYSADGSQYVKIFQQYAETTCVYVKGASGSEVSYWTKNASRSLTGPMLRVDSGGQTWRIVLTSSTLTIYVNGTQYVSLTSGQTVGYPYGSGTVVIPTANLFAKFLGTAAACNFRVDEITYTTTYSPTTAAPIFDPAGPSMVSSTGAVTITCASTGASIYYTTDGSVPTINGTPHSSPATVTVTNGMTLKAMAAVGSNTSWITTQKYTVFVPFLTGIFDDDSVDLTLWTKSGTVDINLGYLIVNGGSVQSINSTLVQNGGLDVTFGDVGTRNSTSGTYNIQMGLYNSDESQYVKVIQQYAEATMVQIKGASGSETTYWINNSGRSLSGPMLRKDSGGQTWRIVLTSNTLKIYVDGTLYVSLSEGQTVNYPYGGGTVEIPTDNLFAKFVESNSTCDFEAGEIVFSSTYSPATAAPTFNPEGPSADSSPVTVTITSATAGASIYYTTDGSTPTTSGTAYSNPTTVSVRSGKTLKAIAVKTDTSWITTQRYKSSVPFLTDTFEEESLDSSCWETFGNVTLNYGCLRVNSEGYAQSAQVASVSDGDLQVTFTGAGTDLWTTHAMEMGLYNSDGSQYVKIVQEYTETTLVYIMGPSGSVTSYWIKNASRSLTGPELRSTSCQNWRLALTADSIKLYVNDVLKMSLSEGDAVSWPYGSGTVEIPTDYLAVKVKGNGFDDFKVDEIIYASTYDPVTEAPTFNPYGPYITGSQSVTISSATSGATIYYTTDGSTPTTSSTLYEGPVSVTDKTNLKAVAVKTDTSLVTRQGYEFSPAAAPVFSPSGKYITGPTAITITCATSGASIYYTTDGSTPSSTSTHYTGAVTVDDYVTLKAIAIASGYTSSTTSVTYYNVPGTGRGKWWVKNHPFQINAIAEQWVDIQQYKDIGFSSYMATNLSTALSDYVRFGEASRIGLGWHWFYRWGAELSSKEDFIPYLTDFIEKYPGCLGVNVGDENDSSYYSAIASDIAKVKELIPEAIVYHAQLVKSDNTAFRTYLDQAVNILKVDVLMYDQYPFNGGSTSSNFYDNLAIVRERALAAGIPYWNWLQGHGWNAPPTYSLRQDPSESEVRLQAFMSLAYGYSGLSYWTYAGTYSPYTNAILNSSGTLSSIGEAVEGAIDEIKNIGAITKDLTSTGVFYITATGESQPTGTAAWTTQTGYSISNVTVNSGAKGFVISLFTGDDGKKYFMIVNGNHAAYTSAADTTARVTITFNSSLNTVQRINRSTGVKETITLANHILSNYSLPGGTGDLFCLTAESELIPGDANGDGAVDVGDLGILAANYGGSNKTWSQGDFNGDGLVDVGDLGILAAHYGTGATSSSSFDADYAKVFGKAVDSKESTDEDNNAESTFCSSFGLSLITGFALLGLMIVKLEE